MLLLLEPEGIQNGLFLGEYVSPVGDICSIRSNILLSVLLIQQKTNATRSLQQRQRQIWSSSRTTAIHPRISFHFITHTIYFKSCLVQNSTDTRALSYYQNKEDGNVCLCGTTKIEYVPQFRCKRNK